MCWDPHEDMPDRLGGQCQADRCYAVMVTVGAIMWTVCGHFV